MEKCPEYNSGKAKEEYFLKNKVILCNAKICKYNKELSTTFEGEKITFCSSKGLLEKIEIDNPDKNKKSNKQLIFNETNSKEIGDISKVRYFEFIIPESQL